MNYLINEDNAFHLPLDVEVLGIEPADIEVLQEALEMMNLAADLGFAGVNDDIGDAEEEEVDFGFIRVLNAMGDPLGEANLDEHIQAILAHILYKDAQEEDDQDVDGTSGSARPVQISPAIQYNNTPSSDKLV
ncbi:hypothetical protein RhiLY_08340 [Ceratobasidium sp. AG-Ba]|nr:hypothetical protein RhiLY_08340 [Ceratobasidium sp. AG-Ba]